MVIAVIIFFAVMCWYAYNAGVKPLIEANAEKKTESYISYNNYSNTLDLKKRGAPIAKAVKIAADKDYTTSYKPEEYVYTGATVGGVTTGGIHKQGGYEYISGEAKTGKYQLQYNGQYISKIQLTDELFREAKNSRIKNYLDYSKKQILMNEEVKASDTVRFAMNSGNMTAARDMYMREMKAGFPTYEKAKSILDWICGN